MKRLRNELKTIDKLEQILQDSYGFPNKLCSEHHDWKKLCSHLLVEGGSKVSESACGAVYWFKANKDWITIQPWYAMLLCEPKKNPLAPFKLDNDSFSVLFEHSTKKGWFGVPRFIGLSLFGPPKIDARCEGTILREDITLNTERELRDYQKKARENALADLALWGGSTIIADCGAGKTAIALSIAAALKRKTLVICNREFLMKQWKSEIEGTGWVWSKCKIPLTEASLKNLQNFQTLVGFFCMKCSTRKKTILYEYDKHYNFWDCNSKYCCTNCGFTFGEDDCDYPEAPKKGWLLNATCGWLQGPIVDTKDRDFVVASIDSLSQCEYNTDVLKQFGLIIIDEMHHLAAKTLSKVLPKIPARYVLGITATPDRGDGLEHLLYWLAGPTSFVYKRLPEITGYKNTVIVHQKIYKDGAQREIYNCYGKLGFASMVSELSREESRNHFILEIVNEMIKLNRRKILIVTSIVNHAKYFAEQLKCIVIHGGCKEEIVVKSKSAECRMLVATFQFLEEGFDDPLIDTLVLALPRSKIQQVVGRCERTHEGKATPIVVDIIDPFSVFQAMSWKRKKFYTSRGFQVIST